MDQKNDDEDRNQNDSESLNGESAEDVENEENIIPRHSQRMRKEKEFPDHVLYLASEYTSEPSSVHEAMNCPESDKWKEEDAMKEEYSSLMENKAWTLVNKEENQKVVQCKWVFQLKSGVDGEERYKARLVARGFTQQYGIDYTETFAPVVRNSTLRLLFGLSVNLNLDIEHIDVTTAFLNSDLNERIIMTA